MSEYIYSSQGEPLANEYGEISLPRREIVRCRDCKLCDERYGRMLCRRDMSCDEIALDVKPDGFCAWGERRES